VSYHGVEPLVTDRTKFLGSAANAACDVLCFVAEYADWATSSQTSHFFIFQLERWQEQNTKAKRPDNNA
jgi:hypothetical protein